MSQIIPAILSTDLVEVKKKLTSLSGLTDWIQIDISDGEFVSSKTIWPRLSKLAWPG